MVGKANLPWQILFTLLFFGCSPKEKEASPRQEEMSSVPRLASEVVVKTAIKRAFEHPIISKGKIVPSVQFEMRAIAAGLIDKVFVRDGQYVSQGDTLLQLNDDHLLFALKRSENELERAEIEYKNMRLGYSDHQINRELDLTLQISSGLSAARLATEEARYHLKTTALIAKQNGMIDGLEVAPGESVTPGALVCTIYDPTVLEVSVDVLQTDFSLLKTGMRCVIRPLSSENKTFEGTVRSVATTVSDKGVIEVRVALSEKHEGELIPGMTTGVVLYSETKFTLLVPKKAIVIRSGKKVVFSVEDQKAKWNFVETGRDNGEWVEVLSGIREGDEVVVEGNTYLNHDVPVAIRITQ